MTARPCTSVVIVTFQSRQHVAACLDSLQATAAAWITDCQVVDNASTDGTAEFVRGRYDGVKVIANPRNVGFGRAVNLGAATARGEYLLLLNPDATVAAGAVAALVRFLDHRREVAACGPKITDARGLFKPECRRGFPTPVNALSYLLRLDRVFPGSAALGGYHRRSIPPDFEVTTDALSGACMMVRSECFRAAEGFDEDYFLFGEDIDLCWKLKQAGHEVWYVPSARVVHEQGASMWHARDVARREFYRSMKLFMDKRLRNTCSPMLIAAAKAGVDAAALFGVRFRVRAVRRQGVVDGQSRK